MPTAYEVILVDWLRLEQPLEEGNGKEWNLPSNQRQRGTGPGVKETLPGIALVERVSYDARQNVLFLNFEGLEVRNEKDIADIREAVQRQCRAAGRRVDVIVNYDAFEIDESVLDAYADMAQQMVERCYVKVSRYTTSAFMRLKLGDELARRNVSPHVFESQEEARRFLAAHER